MSAWRTVVGAVFALLLLAAFPLTLATLPRQPDLQVSFSGTRPFLVEDGAKLPRLAILPTPSPDGLSLSDSTDGGGLDLREWRVTYAHRWERDITLPILRGPFVREGDEVCGIEVAIGAGLFDTAGAGAGLQEILKTKIGEKLPFTYTRPEYDQIHIIFPKPSVAKLTVRMVPGHLVVMVNLVLDDGTLLDTFFSARLVNDDGALALKQEEGQLRYSWAGPTYETLLKQAGNQAVEEHPLIALLFEDFVRSGGVQKAKAEAGTEAGKKLTSMVDDALQEVNLGLAHLRGPHHPIATSPSTTVSLRLAGEPTVTPKGIELRVCGRVHVEDKLDALVPGSAMLAESTATNPKGPDGDSAVTVSIDGDALNHALYFAWQAGLMRELGTSKRVISAALEQSQGAKGEENMLSKLAFDFVGFDPGLPPLISPSVLPDSVGFTLADLKVGQWGERRVVTHAVGDLHVLAQDDAVSLSASLRSLSANCTQNVRGQVDLSPCVSDIIPTVREHLVDHPVSTSINGGELLSKLPSMAIGGGSIKLSDLQVGLEGGHARLNLRVGARIVGAP